MSEYQYYEFQAIDRPLDRAAQNALRAISSRAQITANSFTNHYEWGDFKGNPRALMEQWFDLHVYVTNWGTRQLMIRVPKELINRQEIEPFLNDIDWVEVVPAGDNLIIDINWDEEGADDDWDDGSGWLAVLAPLRADLLTGDLRLFYLIWLRGIDYEDVSEDDLEPLAGIGPLNAGLEALAGFLRIPPDLLQAAAERGDNDSIVTNEAMREALSSIPEDEKSKLLLRIMEGDGRVAVELKRRIPRDRPNQSDTRRTVAALRQRAEEIEEARAREAAEREDTERKRRLEEEAKARSGRLQLLKQRGDAAWREIEADINRRNPSAYDSAMSLLLDLQALAKQEGSEDDFGRRITSIRVRHEKKKTFIERLEGLDGPMATKL